MKREIANLLAGRPRRTYRRDPAKTAQQAANRLYVAQRGTQASRAPVQPSVAAASCEELLAAGWGSHDRHQIPADWRTRRP